jgi:succinate dehydrogenase / fumarate reductase cytochrome b subunit
VIGRIRKVIDPSSDLNPRNMKLGMYSWLVQRATGLFLVFYLLFHITAIAQANFGVTTGVNAEIFNVLRNPFWAGDKTGLALNLILLGLIAFHGLNGIRIVLLDLGYGTQNHRLVFWGFMAIAATAGSYVLYLGLELLGG